jgi:hypothetical protein
MLHAQTFARYVQEIDWEAPQASEAGNWRTIAFGLLELLQNNDKRPLEHME